MKLAFRRTQRKEVIMNTYTAWGENPDDSIVQTAPGRKPTAKKGPDPLKVILTTEQGVQNLQQLLTGCGKSLKRMQCGQFSNIRRGSTSSYIATMHVFVDRYYPPSPFSAAC